MIPDVSIVIVSYNVASLLEGCLRSIFDRPADGLTVELIVVDNASADHSPAFVQQHFPQVRLIANNENYGFPAACNQGWKIATGRYIFFFNPDALLAPDALSRLVGFMEQHPEIGISGPLLRYGDGSLQSSRRRFPTLPLALVESTILQRYPPFKNLPMFKRFYFEDVPPDQAHPVDWLVGAALLIRREVLTQTAGFDERFFMYSEEIDLCQRAKRLGWQVWFVPEAVVTHLEGRSSGQNVPRRHINFNTSKISYFRKHNGPVAGFMLRQFLLATYIFQFAEEGLKLLLGHKPDLRRERLAMIRQIVASKLLPAKFLRPPLSQGVILLSAEFAPQPGGVGDYTACLTEELGRVVDMRVLTTNLTPLSPFPKAEGGGQNTLHKSSFENKKTNHQDTKTSRKNKISWRAWRLGGSIFPLKKREEVYPTGQARGPAPTKISPPSVVGVDQRVYPVVRLVKNWGWGSLGQIGAYLNQQTASLINIQYQTGAYGMHPAVNFLPLYLRWKFGKSRPKVVTTFHDLRVPYLFPKAGLVRWWVNQLLLKSSDAAVVTNQEDYQTALSWGIDTAKLRLIPIGSNISPLPTPTAEERNNWRERWGVDPDDFLVGYFGLLNHSKGVDTLLDGLAQLETGWKLLIIGGGTGESDPTNRAYAQQLVQQIQRLSLSDKIIWTGYLSPTETSQALYCLDVAALPFRDGLSFRRGSLLAALAHGLPIISTNAPENVGAGFKPDRVGYKPTPTQEIDAGSERVGYKPTPTKKIFLKLQKRLSPTPDLRLAAHPLTPIPKQSQAEYANIATNMQLLLEESVMLVAPENPARLAEALRQLRSDPALRANLAASSRELSRNFEWSAISRQFMEVFTAC